MTDHTDRSRNLWGTDHRPIVLSMLGLMTFIAFESFSVTTALPIVAEDLAAEQWYSLAYAATLTTGLVGMTIGGNWTDRRGVAVPLAVGGTMFLVGLALCVLAPSMEIFVVGRLLQGVGGGMDSVVIYAIITQLLHEDVRARMFGVLTATWLLPAIAGPLITGIFVELAGWRLVFAAVLIGAGGSLVTLLVKVRGSDHIQGPTAVFGKRGMWAIAAAAGVLALHYAGQQGLPVLISGTAISVITIGIAASRLLPKGTLRFRPGAPRLIGLRGLLGATVAATDIYLPLYLQHELDYSPTRAGLVVAIGALGWVTGACIQGRSQAEAGAPVVLRRAAAMVLVGPIGAASFVSGFTPIQVTVVGCIVMGIGMGLAYPQITSAVLTQSAASEQGFNSSALQISEALSQSIAIALTGAVLTMAAMHQFVIAYGLVSGIGAVALTVAISSRGPGSPDLHPTLEVGETSPS